MFAAMVFFGAPYTLKVNEHVRVDVIYSALSERARIWIDILGGIFFLLPFCAVLLYFTWPWFLDSWRIGEMSSNAGGLIRWPVKLVLPLGFALLALQGDFRADQAHRRAHRQLPARIQLRDAAAMIEFVRSNMAPLMFAGLIVVMLFGYPAAFSVAAVGLLFGLIGIELGLIEPNFLGNLVYQVFSIVSEEQGALLLAIPFFTFMGAILERSGLAEDLLEFDRPDVRAGARRALLRGDLRRRDPRRHHRHGGGLGDRDGGDRAAADAALRLFRRATPPA